MIEYENLAKLNAPFMDQYSASFEQTLKSGWFILGKNVEAFEREFASYVGANHCVGVASGLDALLLSLKALNLPADAEVLVPSNTYIATILAVLQAGLKPVLVEPDLRTYNLDPQLIDAAVTAKTKAIIIVHLYGKSCEMDGIVAACQKHGLALIEDCAQSHGAKFNGKMTGTFGLGAFSFYPTKNLGALGDAGAITCADEATAQTLRTLRNYGSRVKYNNELLGYNSRLDEVQAGFLSVKLKSLDRINEHKRQLADVYFNELPTSVIQPARDERYFDVYHIFSIRTPRRDQMRAHLLENGVKTDVHYPIAPHKQVAMQGILPATGFPLSENIHNTTLSLPISLFHTREDVREVCRQIRRFEETA